MGFILAIIFFVVFIALFAFTLVLSFVRSLFNSLFGFGNRNQTGNPNQSSTQSTRANTIKETNPKHEKVFKKGDGEYVDFEEVKED